MRGLLAVCCMAALALVSPSVFAQQAKQSQAKKGQAKKVQGKKRSRQARPRVERLACRLGTEDEHARIAVELHNGRVNRFAYYSKWKPRTCSMEVERGDAYSTWEDFGHNTLVTLDENMGAFLIDNQRNRYHFIFRDIDRMRYCGMEGKVSGSLTLFRGRSKCQLQGVMDRGEDSMINVSTEPPAPPPASAIAPAPAPAPVPASALAPVPAPTLAPVPESTPVPDEENAQEADTAGVAAN